MLAWQFERESICLTAPGLLRYKSVSRRTKLCGKKILKTTTSQFALDVGAAGRFFCAKKKKGG